MVSIFQKRKWRKGKYNLNDLSTDSPDSCSLVERERQSLKSKTSEDYAFVLDRSNNRVSEDLSNSVNSKNKSF